MRKMQNYPRLLTLAALLSVAHPSLGYEVPDIKDAPQHPAGNLETKLDWSRTPYGYAELLWAYVYVGEDVMVTWSNCHGVSQKGLSCFKAMRGSGDSSGGVYSVSVDWCLPPRGEGGIEHVVVSQLIPRLLGRLNRKEPNNEAGVHWIELLVAVCGRPGQAVGFNNFSMPESGASCVIDAPWVVDLGTSNSNVEKTVQAEVRCHGDSDTTVRVVAPTETVRPVDGLEFWTNVDPKPIRVGGDGVGVSVPIRLGAKVINGTPGSYSSTFVYELEYL